MLITQIWCGEQGGKGVCSGLTPKLPVTQMFFLAEENKESESCDSGRSMS